jgi:thiol:disulfide interchange protein DsbA
MKTRISWLAAALILTVSASTLAASGNSSKAPKSRNDWRAGYEYSVLIPSEPPENLPPGTVEVRELFLYTSGWSKAVQPYLQKWLESKGNVVRFVREPAIAFPHAREQARMYYTLKALNREDLHIKFFDFVREEHRFDVFHTIRHPAKEAIFDMNIAFAKRNGIDSKAFQQMYTSRDIDNEVIGAEIDATGYALNGTSTIVVNNHYSTSLQRFMGADPACADRGPEPADYERFFALIDQLVSTALTEKPVTPTAAPSAPKGS